GGAGGDGGGYRVGAVGSAWGAAGPGLSGPGANPRWARVANDRRVLESVTGRTTLRPSPCGDGRARTSSRGGSGYLAAPLRRATCTAKTSSTRPTSRKVDGSGTRLPSGAKAALNVGAARTWVASHMF